MKNIFILVLVALLSFPCVNSFAQTMKTTYPQVVQSADRNGHAFSSGARTTAVGDTIVLSNVTTADTLALYAADSGGYATGTDYWGDQAFAELYTFNGYDSSVVVLGVFAEFGGVVNPSHI